MRIFFATDLHGSEICFRKFCAAPDFYRCEALILGGDLTGKMLVAITHERGQISYELGGTTRSFPESHLETELKRISNMGYYAVVEDRDGLAPLHDPACYEARLLQESLARLKRWVAYAQDRLEPKGVPVLVAPGNDDDPSIDSVFEGSSVFILGEQRKISLGSLDVISTGWSNLTPWKTPRECSENELDSRLRSMAASLSDPHRSLYNIHVPPYDTPLDACPKLDTDLRVMTLMGSPVMMHAGSTAVRRVIEDTQPLVSLHGHIHESRNVCQLGRTTSINPGSEYGEGVLLGTVVSITADKVTHTLTAG